jgi:hypothetical protein
MAGPTTHKGYQLRAHDPVRRALLAAVAVALLVLAALAIYWAGYRTAVGLTARERSALTELKTRAAYLEQRNQELTDKAARLGRSAEIDREAARRVQQNLNQMETRLTKLSEELAFYRSIVSSAGAEAGLHLQRFQLRPSGKGYSFSLVLAQLQSSGRQVRGEVRAQIEGTQDGKPRTLDMAKLAQLNLNFTFKYFQDFEGSFELPKGFSPAKVVVSVHPSSRKLKRIEKTYSWAEALNGG